MTTGPYLDQSSQTLNLRWTQGDPVSLAAVIVGGADWAGTYTVESETAGVAALVAAVTAGTITDQTSGAFTAGPGPDAKLTLTLGDSTGVMAGVYGWRLQQTGGPTRLSGSVHVVAS